MMEDASSPLPAIVQSRQAQGPAHVVIAHEAAFGRLLVIEHGITGPDPFLPWQFEVADHAERLDVTTAVRAYEEVNLVRTATTETKTISAVLRRQKAETIIEGDPTLILDPRAP